MILTTKNLGAIFVFCMGAFTALSKNEVAAIGALLECPWMSQVGHTNLPFSKAAPLKIEVVFGFSHLGPVNYIGL